MSEYSEKLSKIDAKWAQVEKEEKALEVRKGVIIDSLNKESKALKDLGHDVTNAKQAQKLKDEITPQLESLVNTMSANLGIK